jgi:putative two-component system response regulator
MSQMSAMLGKASGLDDAECDLILNASPMHDIGKIGIPDAILQKPGKLDAEEWEIMKTHAQIGADLLDGDDSDLLTMARTIALTHHEKWNGKGYPNGIAGEDIPLVGRIVAIADVFDALTSDRPYKKAWPIEDAIDLIRSESGEHFDPQLVNYFLEIIKDVISISEKYSDQAKS